MELNTDVDALATAIAKKMAAAIPIEIDMWGAAEIGAYLKVKPRQVTERLVLAPGFPKATRLPTSDGGRMHPRWKAIEIIKWVDKNSRTS